MSQLKWKKWLVGIDHSENSERAFQRVLNLVEPRDEVILATVVEPFDASWGNVLRADCDTQVLDMGTKRVVKDTATALEELAKELQARHIKHEIMVIAESNPREVLCQLAKQKEVFAIVLGRRGLSPLKRLMLGSVSEYCANHCESNVIIVR